ncbi:unnamed protein product [Schistosoma margrebowiei]|uniref:Uncharacterized protein n=1 Tax=Schistosoma margrebowiei TaxID=48269 RepID=A0A183LKY5_9TREM|nr:unnamed protein product [Schistosoma margrebowiei]
MVVGGSRKKTLDLGFSRDLGRSVSDEQVLQPSHSPEETKSYPDYPIELFKSSIFKTEEHLELKATVNQHQGQDFQYKCQDSSTVWGGNLENYESHHPEDASVY